MLSNLFNIILILQLVSCIPIPVITRYHTAEAITTTLTITSGTSVTWLPPVEILISNGVTYTITKYDATTLANQQKQVVPTTSTVIYNDPVETTTNAAATPDAAATPATPATAATPATPATPATAATPATPAEATQADNTQAENTPAPTTAAANNDHTTVTELEIVTSTTVEGGDNNNGGNNDNTAENQSADQQTTTEQAPQPTTTQDQTTQETTQDQTTTSSSPAQTSSTSGGIGNPSYLVYSPYQNNGDCKDYDTVESDINYIHSRGINKLRIYGSDCNVFETVLPVAKSLGILINQGFWFQYGQSPDSIDSGVQDFITWGEQNGWDIIDFVTVGNEAINDKTMSVDQLIDKISDVKSKLNAAGYTGRITTSEPPVTFINYPNLCTESVIDFVGINPHSYFNQGISPENAGQYAATQQAQVDAVCGGKSSFITETGYPSQGDVNGLNDPTPENQRIALQSIFDVCGHDVTILSAWNDFWKNPGPYGIEQYFGSLYLF